MTMHTLRQALWRTLVCAVAIVTISWTAQPMVTYGLEESTEQVAQQNQPPAQSATETEAIETIPEEIPTDAPQTTIPATTSTPAPLSTSSSSTSPTTTTEVTSSNTINNTVSSSATSGNATGSTNTEVGAITTGNATATVTLINTLLANLQLGNGNSQPILFTYNVHGTLDGNLLIDPEVLAASSPQNGSESINPDPIALSAESHATITNDLTLSAASGTATAHQNTTAGDVTSGSATALVNAINIINSSIAADKSFIGMINIYGDLDGDILLPYGFVSQILAAQNAAGNPQSQSTTTTHDANATVINNVNASANSGNTNVHANTITGTITSGGATTNVTILDLTTQEIVGTNALLVFVNVMGSWIGLLLDAPVGTTSAALGNGGGGTSNATDTSLSSDLTIENTINVSAGSGNANATENTSVGNVHTGSAHAGVNLLNIINSSVSLSNWFGVLFINVFGTWTGDFAIAPESTQPPAVPTPAEQPTTPQPSSNPAPLISFAPRSTSSNTRLSSVLSASTTAEQPETSAPAAVQSDSIENTAATPLQLETAEEESSSSAALWLTAGGAILLVLLGFVLFRRLQQRNIS